MNFEIINDILESFIILKIGFLILILFNTIFLFIVYSQVNSMNRIINQANASSLIKLVSILSIAFSFSLFLLAVVIL